MLWILSVILLVSEPAEVLLTEAHTYNTKDYKNTYIVELKDSEHVYRYVGVIYCDYTWIVIKSWEPEQHEQEYDYRDSETKYISVRVTKRPNTENKWRVSYYDQHRQLRHSNGLVDTIQVMLRERLNVRREVKLIIDPVSVLENVYDTYYMSDNP